jgi:hypothetical protein
MKKLTEVERLEIARRLAVMDRQMLVGVREVAVLYNTSIASIQQACSKNRLARGDVALRLPPRIGGLGRRVVWLHGDVRDCVAQAHAQAQALAVAQAQAHAATQAPGAAGTEHGQLDPATPAQAPDATKPSVKDQQSAKRMGRKRKA